MKFLIIGFTGAAQQEVEQFIEQELFGHSYESIAMQFSASLEPILPQVSTKETHSDFCIIDLDGIGIHQFNDLLTILANRPAIFVGQQISQGLKTAIKHSTQAKIDVLEKPYDKEQLNILLLKAIRLDSQRAKASIYTSTQMNEMTPTHLEAKPQIAKQSIYTSNIVPTVHTSSKIQQKKIKTSIYDTKPIISVQSATLSKKVKPKNSIYTSDNLSFTPKLEESESSVLLESCKSARELIQKVWINFDEYDIYADLFDAFAQQAPSQVLIGDYEFLVDAKQNSIIAPDIIEFLAYIEQLNIAQRHHLHIKVKDISDNYIQLMNIYLQNDYQHYALNLFLWQFYHQFLSDELAFDEYELRLRIKVLPKFIEMEKVPAYMHAVVSSCLQKSQDIEQLQQTQKFSFLTLAQMQRIYILSILAHYADIEFMQNLLQRKPQLNPTQVIEQASSHQSLDKNPNLFKRILGKF